VIHSNFKLFHGVEAMANHQLFAPKYDQMNALSPCVSYDFPKSKALWNKIILVGEAPGAEEARQGRPFVGRSGKLLDDILKRAGMARDECLVANVFRSRPPENKVDHFFISQRKARENNIDIETTLAKFGSSWLRSEFASDINYLRQTLSKWQPKLVVSLGRTPLWALTGQGGLLSRVGVVMPSNLVPDLNVLPTYHPSFILRGNWALQDDWANHFIAANHYNG
jgi:DNA polymerase